MGGAVYVLAVLSGGNFGLTSCAIGIGEAEWAFKTDIAVTDEELAASAADLVFDGLDTFATVSLVSE